MACLNTLKLEIKTLERTFTKNHERFRILHASVDELTCRFIGKNGKNYDIHANITVIIAFHFSLSLSISSSSSSFFLWYDLVMYKFRDAEATTTRTSIQKKRIVSILFTAFLLDGHSICACVCVCVFLFSNFKVEVIIENASFSDPLCFYSSLRFALAICVWVSSLPLCLGVCVCFVWSFFIVPFRIRLCPCLSCVSPLVHVKQLLGCLCICVCVFRYFSKYVKKTLKRRLPKLSSACIQTRICFLFWLLWSRILELAHKRSKKESATERDRREQNKCVEFGYLVSSSVYRFYGVCYKARPYKAKTHLVHSSRIFIHLLSSYATHGLCTLSLSLCVFIVADADDTKHLALPKHSLVAAK